MRGVGAQIVSNDAPRVDVDQLQIEIVAFVVASADDPIGHAAHEIDVEAVIRPRLQRRDRLARIYFRESRRPDPIGFVKPPADQQVELLALIFG